MKKNKVLNVVLVFVLSIFLLGCNQNNSEYLADKAIQLLVDNVDDENSLMIESVKWVEDDFDTIIFLISYDIQNDSNEYIGYSDCYITYYEHPEEHPTRPAHQWYISFEDNDILNARYQKALQENDQNELTSQKIEEILADIRLQQ
jgi:hypothetical protein